MPRVLTALAGLLAIAAVLLLLRQQNLRLRHACNELHGDLFDVEQTLWRQQVQVAAATSPSAVDAVRELQRNRRDEPAQANQGEWASLAAIEVDDAW